MVITPKFSTLGRLLTKIPHSEDVFDTYLIMEMLLVNIYLTLRMFFTHSSKYLTTEMLLFNSEYLTLGMCLMNISF